MSMADNNLKYAQKKIQLAKLEESDLLPVYQSLTLKNDQDDICLLQLTPELTNLLTEGETLVIRGDPNDSAVLCTQTKTFDLKEAETSNSLILVQDLQWPETCQGEDTNVVDKSISGIFHTYLEVKNIKPSFKKLRSLLSRNPYQGKEYEDSSNAQDKFTYQNLLDVIQSSEDELTNELKTMQTCVIDGYVRILDFDYKFNVFSSILNVIESQSIPIDKIPKETVLNLLESLEPMHILENCFLWFTNEVKNEDGSILYALQEDIVCRLYAEILLRSTGRFHLQEFLDSWQCSVPDGMKCDLKQLRGMALTDLTSRPEVIFYYPSHDLPENIKDRFDQLFRIKGKWEYEEIVPYLEDRAGVGNDVKTLLVKFTRESTRDGKKVYSSKW